MRIDRWLARRATVVALALVLAAGAVRAVYFAQLQDGPLIDLHRLDETDMHYYDGWGRRIAAGDWLSRDVLVPMHPWHVETAEAYFRIHPERRAALGERGDPATALWREWMRTPHFYQDPLYAYAIGGIYAVAGEHPHLVLVCQLALGLLSVWLVWSLTRRWFGDLAAAAAGVLAVGCAPLVYYELVLLRESTIVVAGLLVAWLADRAFRSGGLGAFLLLGLAAGLALSLKSTFAVLILLVGAAIAWQLRGRALRVGALAYAAGLCLGVAPLAARNLAVGVPPLALASSGPLTFAFANGAGYDVDAGFAIDRRHLARVLGETDGGFAAVAAATLRAQTPGGYLALIARKLDRAWHWYEIPNNEDFYYMRAQVPLLRWLPVTFWAVAPLGAIGLVLGGRRIRAAWPLYALVAATLLPLVIFYVLGRFRVSLLAALLPFAGLAVARIGTWLVTPGRRLGAAGALAGVIGVLLVTGRPLPSNRPLVRPDDWFIPYLVEYRDRIKAAMDAGDRPAAIAAFEATFRYEPEPGRLDALADGVVARFFARMHQDCAELLRQSGQPTEARRHDQRARAFGGG